MKRLLIIVFLSIALFIYLLRYGQTPSTIPAPSQPILNIQYEETLSPAPEEKIISHQEEEPLSGPQSISVTQFMAIDNYAIAFGDILIAPLEEIMELERLRQTPELSPPQLWPEGKVYYDIELDFEQEQKVLDSIEFLHQNTFVRFIPVHGQENYVVFKAGSEHCFAHLGMTGGRQKVVLSPHCGMKEILHEIMHTLGFVHEQNRPDRDQYLKVYWEHIKDGYQEQFQIMPTSFYSKSDFDFKSTMLYHPFYFSKDPDRLPTLSREDGTFWKANESELLSEGDLKKINSLYPDPRPKDQ